MAEQDIELRRKSDLERYHRRTAERRARGVCVKCGKRPPTPGRTQCEPCAAKKRPADRARHHRRTAERVARGLCPKCGKVPPAPERSQCEPCLEKDRTAGRARDARLSTAGIPRRDPGKAREYERKRARRQTEMRRAEGLCTGCGNAPAAPGRVSCEPCLEQRRAEDRARYAAGKAAGKPYGGANAEMKRRCRPRQGQAAQEGVARGRAVPALRQAPGGRGRQALHALPGEAPGEGAPQVCRTARRRALHELRNPRLRRPGVLRPLRRHPRRPPSDGAQERSREMEVCRTALARAVHRLRRAVPGRRALRTVRPPVV